MEVQNRQGTNWLCNCRRCNRDKSLQAVANVSIKHFSKLLLSHILLQSGNEINEIRNTTPPILVAFVLAVKAPPGGRRTRSCTKKGPSIRNPPAGFEPERRDFTEWACCGHTPFLTHGALLSTLVSFFTSFRRLKKNPPRRW